MPCIQEKRIQQALLSVCLAATALAWLPAGAAAQGNPYCEGRVQAASFYSTTSSTGSRSTVIYHLIVQSMIDRPQYIAVVFTNGAVQSAANGTLQTCMARWGTSQAIMLGVSALANPAGSGGLNVPVDLVAGTRIACRDVRPGS